EPAAETARFADIEVDFTRCEVRRRGEPIEISALEFKLLEVFLRNRGRVLTREQLLEAAWGRGVALNDRVVDNHIVGLRRKIEPDRSLPRSLLTMRRPGAALNARVVDHHIVGLRRKIEPDPSRPRYLLNIRGLGYRFDA